MTFQWSDKDNPLHQNHLKHSEDMDGDKVDSRSNVNRYPLHFGGLN